MWCQLGVPGGAEVFVVAVAPSLGQHVDVIPEVSKS